uniref:Uncharacterized protein n=1 Tax=Sphaeramia orbicularis TaxID=375764 RepID=A0A673BY88_9TELE
TGPEGPGAGLAAVGPGSALRPQTSQTWSLRLDALKLFPHSSQVCGVAPLCVRRWRCSDVAEAKLRSQSVQVNGLRPVWMRSWTSRAPRSACEKWRPHTSQPKARRPAWTSKWRRRLDFSPVWTLWSVDMTSTPQF